MTIVNSQARADSKAGRQIQIWRRGSGQPIIFPDIEPTARLSRNQAILHGDTIAVAYKVSLRRRERSLGSEKLLTDSIAAQQSERAKG
jgi:hypothetical protein